MEVLVEECCEGAVVGRLPYHDPFKDDTRQAAAELAAEMREHHARYPMLPAIPIAQTIPSLAVAVAQALLEQYSAPDRLRGCELIGVPAIAPPFAAAYYDRAGVRTYVLASGECECCRDEQGRGVHYSDPDDGVAWACQACSGTGARTDVGAIADRYQPDRPWRDEDTPRLARFESGGA
jgi:hypothetical protein